MTQLLKIEWLKLKNYRAFIVLSIFFVIGVFASNYIVYSVMHNMVNQTSAGAMVGIFNPYSFSGTWQTTSYVTGFLLILPAMLLIISITNEFTFRTSRQNIIDGWNREQFISVKLMMAFIAAAACTVLVAITALVFGATSGTDFSTNGISHIGFFFIKALTYNIIAVFISVLIRKTGFAIGLYFIYLGAENIISQILDVVSLNLRNNENLDLGSIGDYLPMNASDGLLTFPDNPMKSIARSALPTDYTWLVMILAAVYLILFYFLSRKNILKKDL